jgi:hypothetical protein
MKKLTKTLFILAGLTLTSCTQRLVDFTIISTKNVDLSRANSFRRAAGRTTGEDAKQIIIIFPLGTPSAKEAVDRAIESVPGGVALVDGVLSNSFFYIPYIIGESKYVVEGTVLIDPTLVTGTASTIDSSKPHTIVYCDKKGNVKSRLSVTSEEYRKFKKDHHLLAMR